MMYACGYFLYSDGLFSYTSFVAIEVICISTVMAILMLIDAMQGLRCRSRKDTKLLDSKIVKSNIGADYESEDENQEKRIMKKRKDQLEFGADEVNDSNAPFRVNSS